MAPFLLIDIGNTRFKWATALAKPGAKIRLEGAHLTPGTPAENTAQIRALAEHPDYAHHRIILASVVPSLTARLVKAFRGRPLIVLRADLPTLGYPFAYANPLHLGADRLADAAAAHAARQFPALTINCGTATVMNVLDLHGSFSGGLILPGLMVQLHSLQQRAAQLRSVEVDLASMKSYQSKGDRRLLAKSTAEAMEMGALLSFRGGLREAVRELNARMNFKTIYLTGGNRVALSAPFLKALAPPGVALSHQPQLTFRGLHEIGLRSF